MYVGRNDNVHAKYCFKHWTMDDTVTASCIKSASTGFSDILVFFPPQIYRVWTYYLFLEETANITSSEILKVRKSSENVM